MCACGCVCARVYEHSTALEAIWQSKTQILKREKISRKIKKRTSRVIEIKHQMSAAGEVKKKWGKAKARTKAQKSCHMQHSARERERGKMKKMAATWLTSCKRASNLNLCGNGELRRCFFSLPKIKSMQGASIEDNCHSKWNQARAAAATGAGAGAVAPRGTTKYDDKGCAHKYNLHAYVWQGRLDGWLAGRQRSITCP